MLIKGWLCFKQWINMLTDHMAIHQVSLTSYSWINCTCTTLIKHGFKSFMINRVSFQPMIRTAEVFLRDATAKKITADIKFKFRIKLPNILPSIYDNSISFSFSFFSRDLFSACYCYCFELVETQNRYETSLPASTFAVEEYQLVAMVCDAQI